MIWEALNKQQGNNRTGESSLYQLICRQNPVTNSKSSVQDPDHYEPIHALNTFQTLINTSFQGRNLFMDDYTLSNILIIIGTGQGMRTERFFQQYLQGKWFQSADACVSTFKQAHLADPDLPLDNMKCWGTPCSWLAFKCNSNNSPLFQKRIKPMFSAEGVKLWQACCQKSHCTYSNGLQLAKDTGIAGFVSGITQMQFANTLVLLGVCSLPNCNNMAKVIQTNK